MQILISDANILLDLDEGRLIERLFLLSYEFRTPDILFMEELAYFHNDLLKMGLMLSELSSESIDYAMKLMQQYPKPSTNDCFALALAVQEDCPLLTGDKDLRNAAKKEKVEVKGTVWLVEQMIIQQLVTVAEVKAAYQLMRKAGRRLPWKEVEKRLMNYEL